MKPIAAALLALSLASCDTTAETMKKESPAYNAGFSDGCATASAEGSGAPRPPQRDAMLFAADKDYRAGWGAGHGFCRAQSGAQGF